MSLFHIVHDRSLSEKTILQLQKDADFCLHDAIFFLQCTMNGAAITAKIVVAINAIMKSRSRVIFIDHRFKMINMQFKARPAKSRILSVYRLFWLIDYRHRYCCCCCHC
jgi:hypothetical protein